MRTKKFTLWVMVVVAGFATIALTFGCSASEEPAAAPQVVEVVKEVPVEKVVVKEVVKEVPVEKEVVKEVEVEKVVKEEVVKEVEVEKVVVKEVEVEVPAMSGPITPTGTMVVAASSIATPSGWPTFAPNWQTLAMTRVQEALMHGDIDGRGNLTYHPWLAESWDMAPDLSYTDFNIREGVQFHKGWGELTAEDIAWSWNAGNPVLTPEAVHDTLPWPEVGRLDALGKYVVRLNWTPFGVKGYWLPATTLSPSALRQNARSTRTARSGCRKTCSAAAPMKWLSG